MAALILRHVDKALLLLTWDGCYNGHTSGHGNQAGGKISK